MNPIIEKISWMPFEFIKKIKYSKKDFVKFNMNQLGVNKSFNLFLSKNDEGLSTQFVVFGFREPLNLKYSYEFVNSSDKVLDIGSNIGLFPLLSENAKEIVCVEPLKEAIPLLKKNIEANNLKKKTKIINAAIGKKGRLILEVDKKLNLSKIVDKPNKYTYEIKSFNLKDMVKKYNSNLIRMDVEGYEYEILHKKIPKKITKISLEFHTALLGKKKVKELLDYLENEKFKVKFLIEDLPIRLYPFHNFLKKVGLIKNLTYIKKNLRPKECLSYINKGRTVKYLFLER